MEMLPVIMESEQYEGTRRLRILLTVLAFYAVALPLLFAGPLGLYCANQLEFKSGIGDIFFPELPSALVGIGLLAIIFSWALPVRALHALHVVCFSLSACFYAQGVLLVWEYGQFDGAPIDWGKLHWRAYVDWGLWIALGVSAAFFYSRNVAKSLSLFLFLLLIQLISGLIPAFRQPPHFHKEITIPDLRRVFDFSPEKNVVMILLDEFSSAAFDKLHSSSAEYQELFRGFTFYRNTAGLFPTTYPSLPAILSGEIIKKDESISAHLKERMPQSLPAKFQAAGYSSSVITFHPLCGSLPVDACLSLSQVIGHSVKRMERAQLLQLIDLSLFRYAPHTIKHTIHNDDSWLLQGLGEKRKGAPLFLDSEDFTKTFLREAQADSKVPTFKFFHLMIPHAPYRRGPECEFKKVRGRKIEEAYLDNARCGLKLTADVLEKLRTLNIFDNSLIVILADHGTYVPIGEFKKSKEIANGVRRSWALFLMHRPGQALSTLQISEDPLQLTDVPAMVASQLALEGSASNFMSAIQSMPGRTRTYYHYQWENAYWQNDLLPPLTEYKIQGHVYDPAAWTRVTPKGKKEN